MNAANQIVSWTAHLCGPLISGPVAANIDVGPFRSRNLLYSAGSSRVFFVCVLVVKRSIMQAMGRIDLFHGGGRGQVNLLVHRWRCSAQPQRRPSRLLLSETRCRALRSWLGEESGSPLNWWRIGG